MFAPEIIILKNLLPMLMVSLPLEADRVVAEGMQRVVEYAIAHHPWQNRTGFTEESIHVEQTDDHEYTGVFGGASIYLEWGTVHMHPFPFIQPAWDAIEPTIEEAFTHMFDSVF